MTQTSKTGWERLAKMNDEAIDTSEIPELDAEFFRRAELRVPVKQADQHAEEVALPYRQG
ncbi:hypothetical protein C4J92_3794 [Pseudomonas sp. R3-18-08]|nr:hypothetical protein C4J92_3794 [Pseudomonas sp. R3-18-08]